jgi:hypothetical protein
VCIGEQVSKPDPAKSNSTESGKPSDNKTPPQTKVTFTKEEDDDDTSSDEDFNDAKDFRESLAAPTRKKMGPSLGKGRACVKCRARKMVRWLLPRQPILICKPKIDTALRW